MYQPMRLTRTARSARASSTTPAIEAEQTVMKHVAAPRPQRSDAMYLINEALARARCANDQRQRQVSRPAREVAIEAARQRRRSG